MLGLNKRQSPLERFTPTCVGNAVGAVGAEAEQAVHPHVCGECTTTRAMPTNTIGSPPRVWGMRPWDGSAHELARFTPTCVGNATSTARRAARQAVHPHVCGECLGHDGRDAHDGGSPPRVWGMLRRLLHGVGHGRFTPTCVGNAG